tara:strand:+ start:620 stop:787 length:168 start_codon:yes stop_codon:yes gene_type:complete
MTASQQVKQAGLASLSEVVAIAAVPLSTVNTWHKTKPQLFAALVAGCASIKHSAD